MLLGSWIIIASTFLYAGAAIAYFYQGSYAMASTYICYAGANIGLVLVAEGSK